MRGSRYAIQEQTARGERVALTWAPRVLSAALQADHRVMQDIVVVEKFLLDPFAPELLIDPYPTYARIRAQPRVYMMSATNQRRFRC